MTESYSYYRQKAGLARQWLLQQLLIPTPWPQIQAKCVPGSKEQKSNKTLTSKPYIITVSVSCKRTRWVIPWFMTQKGGSILSRLHSISSLGLWAVEIEMQWGKETWNFYEVPSVSIYLVTSAAARASSASRSSSNSSTASVDLAGSVVLETSSFTKLASDSLAIDFFGAPVRAGLWMVVKGELILLFEVNDQSMTSSAP